jgi:hypothetical protein
MVKYEDIKQKDAFHLSHGSDRFIKALLWVLYFIAVLIVAVHAFRKPEYNWDMLPYMALTLKIEHQDVDLVHKETYRIAKENMSSGAYAMLVDSSIPYRKKMYENPSEFYKQLPFYSVKPLYIGLIYLAYKSGIPLPAATVFPSALCFLLISFLLLYCLQLYLQQYYAIIFSFLIMITAPMLHMAGISTPDGVSAFIMLSAMYFVVVKPRLWPLVALLLLSIFTRLDNVITCIAIVSLLAFSRKSILPIKRRQYVIILLLLLLSYVVVAMSASAYGWSLFYYTHFFRYLNLEHEYHAGFSLKEYLQVLYSHVIAGLYYSNMVVCLILIGLISLRKPGAKISDWSFEQLFACCILGVIAVRTILYPDISDRFYIPYYLIIYILFIRRYASMFALTTAKN